MIDIHTHILPGVDDGADSVEVSEEMLRMAAGNGTTAIVATPHANLQYEFDPERSHKLLAQIRQQYTGAPLLYSGCELHLTPENIEKVLREPKQFTLNGGDCVLLELPDAVIPQVVEPALDMLFNSGLRVIIAHPERNPCIQRQLSYADHLVEMGCYLQLTAQSIQGGFGVHAKSASGYILGRRLAHFVASDAHGATARRPLLAAAFQKITSRYGEAAAQALFVENPGAAVASSIIRQMPLAANWFTALFSRRIQNIGEQSDASNVS